MLRITLPREHIIFESSKGTTTRRFQRKIILVINSIMATAAVQHAPGNTLDQVVEPLAQESKPAKHDVATELNYYQDPGDGSLPAPFYVG